MKYREIKLEGNKSILVDESAEIKEGDKVEWFGKILDCNSFSEIDNQYYIGNNFENIALEPKTVLNKVIATINHSISLDVPMVILKDEVEKKIQSLKQKYIELEMKETIKECNYCSKTIREQSNGCTNILCYRQYLKTITTDRINGQLFAYIKH